MNRSRIAAILWSIALLAVLAAPIQAAELPGLTWSNISSYVEAIADVAAWDPYGGDEGVQDWEYNQITSAEPYTEVEAYAFVDYEFFVPWEEEWIPNSMEAQSYVEFLYSEGFGNPEVHEIHSVGWCEFTVYGVGVGYAYSSLSILSNATLSIGTSEQFPEGQPLVLTIIGQQPAEAADDWYLIIRDEASENLLGYLHDSYPTADVSVQAGQMLNIEFQHFTGVGHGEGDNSDYGYVDGDIWIDFTICNVIPEPATLLLFAPAILGFAGVVHRKMRRR